MLTSKSSTRAVFVTGLVALICFCTTSSRSLVAEELVAAADVKIVFKDHIQPILKKNCVRCHGEKRQKSGYRLDSREATLTSGEIGKSIVLGNSKDSPFIHYVAGIHEDLEMPPSGDPLSSEQIALLRAWIDQELDWTEAPKEVVKIYHTAEIAEAHKDLVTNVAFAPGGARLASAGGQSLPFRPGEVVIWDVASKKELSRLEGQESLVWGLASHPTARRSRPVPTKRSRAFTTPRTARSSTVSLATRTG